MDTPSTPVSPSSQAVPPTGSLPEHPNAADGTSLIRSSQPKHSRHLVLWLLVIIALGGAGFSSYMVMQDRAAMATSQQSMTEWANRLTMLEQKLTTVSTKVDTLAATPSPLPTPTSPIDFESLLPSGFPLTTSPSALPTIDASAAPVVTMPNMTGDDSSADISDGRMTAEDEHGMLEFYMQSIRIGEHKTKQPDDISLVKNRQMTEDKMFNYDVFKSKATDELYIYARKSATNTTADFEDGWYGPFPAFPGA